jgi:glycosyltransferase involved in cell wall biosynthesis
MTEKKSILCVIDDLCPGGAQRQLVVLGIELKKRGFDVKFLIYNKKLFYKEILNKNGIDVELLAESNLFSRVINFRKYIKNEKVDIIISFLAVPSFLASFASFPIKKWKLIVGERSSNPAIVHSIKSKLLRKFYFMANYIVANSNSNLSLIKQILPNIKDLKFKVIYNLIDNEIFDENPEFKYRENNKFRIIIPASYRKLKNLIGLIHAVENLDSNYKNNLLIDWYGDKSKNSHQDNILNDAEVLIQKFNLKKIFTLNDVEQDIYNKIKNADAVGLFSFFEGLPNSVCEGMACSKPIIATNVSDVSIILQDEKGGKLCYADDINSITNAIKYLMDLDVSELRKMGELNRKIAVDLFDKNINVEKYISLFY